MQKTKRPDDCGSFLFCKLSKLLNEGKKSEVSAMQVNQQLLYVWVIIIEIIIG